MERVVDKLAPNYNNPKNVTERNDILMSKFIHFMNMNNTLIACCFLFLVSYFFLSDGVADIKENCVNSKTCQLNFRKQNAI